MAVKFDRTFFNRINGGPKLINGSEKVLPRPIDTEPDSTSLNTKANNLKITNSQAKNPAAYDMSTKYGRMQAWKNNVKGTEIRSFGYGDVVDGSKTIIAQNPQVNAILDSERATQFMSASQKNAYYTEKVNQNAYCPKGDCNPVEEKKTTGGGNGSGGKGGGKNKPKGLEYEKIDATPAPELGAKFDMGNKIDLKGKKIFTNIPDEIPGPNPPIKKKPDFNNIIGTVNDIAVPLAQAFIGQAEKLKPRILEQPINPNLENVDNVIAQMRATGRSTRRGTGGATQTQATLSQDNARINSGIMEATSQNNNVNANILNNNRQFNSNVLARNAQSINNMNDQNTGIGNANKALISDAISSADNNLKMRALDKKKEARDQKAVNLMASLNPRALEYLQGKGIDLFPSRRKA